MKNDLSYSAENAISVKGLSKCYEIYDKPHHRLFQMIMQGHRQFYREFWALRDLSLDIKRGQTIGILGRNGSGKSTLLKLICGTLNPTSGSIETNGRIAAILELGSGFNPEFTGRENVYMKASILGLKSDEVDEIFDSIADFAEIGDFMDQPVKTYSSGMMVRLAFAVSVNVDPEILVVDEALSVGDEKFQRKCFSRIESIKEAGATILFVSHSGPTVVSLCDKAVLLDNGEQIAYGHPKNIYGNYQKLLYAPSEKRNAIRDQIIGSCLTPELQDDFENTGPTKNGVVNTKHDSLSENSDARKEKELQKLQESYDPYLIPTSTINYEIQGAQISSPRIEDLKGAQVNVLVRGRVYRFVYQVHFSQIAEKVRFGMLIKTKSGTELGGAVTAATRERCIEKVQDGEAVSVSFDFKCSLTPGVYFLNAGVQGEIDNSGLQIYLHRLLDAAMFKVQPEANLTSTCTVDFECESSIEFMR